MNVPPQIQAAADEIRKKAEARPFDGDGPPDRGWVRVLGPNGRGGVQLAFTVSSAGAEQLILKTEGFSPPKNKTIRRWCAAFWGDFREAEWEIEGTTVQCWLKAGSRGAAGGS